MIVSFRAQSNVFKNFPDKSPLYYDNIETGEVIKMSFNKSTGYYDAELEVDDEYLELIIDLVRGNCVSVKEGEFILESKPKTKE